MVMVKVKVKVKVPSPRRNIGRIFVSLSHAVEPVDEINHCVCGAWP